MRLGYVELYLIHPFLLFGQVGNRLLYLFNLFNAFWVSYF
jgi:hypothetical protein